MEACQGKVGFKGQTETINMIDTPEILKETLCNHTWWIIYDTINLKCSTLLFVRELVNRFLSLVFQVNDEWSSSVKKKQRIILKYRTDVMKAQKYCNLAEIFKNIFLIHFFVTILKFNFLIKKIMTLNANLW